MASDIIQIAVDKIRDTLIEMEKDLARIADALEKSGGT